MTGNHMVRTKTGLSRVVGMLSSRWSRWRAFHRLVLELRTKTDDELRDAGLDPISRRLMAKQAIYGN